MPGTSLEDLLQVLVEIRDELRLFRSRGAASDGDARWFDIEAAASYHRPTDLRRENRQSSHIAEGAAAREILVSPARSQMPR
jgi:hypothetical protein